MRYVTLLRSLTRTVAPLAALAGALIMSTAASADIHPNHAQGFEPEKLYQFDGLENVNVFNGNLNLALPIGPRFPVGGSLSYGFTLAYTGNVWEWEEKVAFCDPGGSMAYAEAIPRKRSNAGLGWQFHLGRLNPPQSVNNSSGFTEYESPDGALHRFRSSLHADGTTSGDYVYTQDGTYLRFNEATRTLEHPDGTIRRFDSQDRLTSIEDRFGNSVSVSYLSSPTRWVISDGHRSHTIYFKTVAQQTVVDRVALAAFGGKTANYTFHYSATEIVRGHTDPFFISSCGVSRTVTVPLLRDVTLGLDGGKTWEYSMPDYDLGPASGTSTLSGHIEGLVLPTGGKMEWDWALYIFPQASAQLGSGSGFSGAPGFQKAFSTAAGLLARRHRNFGGTLFGEWSYSVELDSNTPQKELQVTITDPLGHPTKNFFSVYSELQSSGGWDRDEYGLPFSRYLSDGTSPGRFVSREIRNAGGTLLRRIFVRYERDGATKANPRMASRRTVYLDDGGKFADTDFSDWDGLGHYRQQSTNGNFPAGNVRTVFTDYNPGSCAMCQPSTSSPWVLGTFTHQTVSEGGATAKTEACFQASTGFLLRTRTLESGTSRGSDDVVTRFLKDSAGNVTAEESFGGDTQSVGTGGLCGLALPTAQYRVNHTYQFGQRRSSQPQGMPFKSLDLDIDANTGLPKTSRDTAGLATTLEYDRLGRLTWEKPAQDGWNRYVHFQGDFSTGTFAQVIILRRPNGGGSNLAERRVQFDGLGRVWRERTLMPDGTRPARETLYDGVGNVASVSSVGAISQKTRYLSYDPFGRPGVIRPPEGSSHDVVLSYNGDRRVVRNVQIGTGWNGSAVTETQATTIELYGRQGRLFRVREPANPDGTLSTTNYFYDVGGRLDEVRQTAKNAAGSSFTQTRLFNYDNRGFLTSERHPEKGSSGNGWVTYSNYDSRGNPGRVIDGPNDVTFTYDGAARLTQVRETGVGGRILKSFTYGTSNGTGDWRLGKLQVARGYNYPVVGGSTFTVQLAETYTYGGKQGRVSARDTQTFVNGGAEESFTQSWTWNDLGEVASTTYPRCTHTGCGAGTIRTVSRSYTNGFLTAVPGYASSITYHPNHQVHHVVRSNDTTDIHTKDPHNRARPRKIQTRTTSTDILRWHTGLYQYDGAGNVTKQGNAYFLYDHASRIQDGLLYLGPGAGGATTSFDHSYDGFGNLQSMTAGGVFRNTSTSSSTNRLSGLVSYDAAGNLTHWNGTSYSYDQLNRLWRVDDGTDEDIHLYTADGERLWTFSLGNPSRWTLRDLDGKVLREYENDAGVWSIQRDYVYQGSQLLAAHTADASPEDLVHYHPDHLGTPRATTNKNGFRIAYHVYYPFGEEATSPTQDTERMKFTGHERDLGDTSSPADDLDYMHARFYNPQVGRFLAVDPSKRSWDPQNPQSWNRNAYALSNPLRNIDRDGRVARPAYGKNQDIRAAVAMTLEKIPLVGGGLAATADFLIADFFPVNRGEFSSSVDSMVAGFGAGAVLNPGTKAGKVGTKLQNIFTENLDTATIQAAARETAGEVVARKASGEAFDHVTQFNRGVSRARKHVVSLQKLLGDPRLTDAQRAHVQFLLSKFSKKLDQAEELFENELKKALPE